MPDTRLPTLKPLPEGAIVSLPLRLALDLYMVSDPWPLDEAANDEMGRLLDDATHRYGYAGWVDAYHEGGTA